jgi:hypothetical protein
LKKLQRYGVKSNSDLRASPYQTEQGTTTHVPETREHLVKIPPPKPRVNRLAEIAKTSPSGLIRPVVSAWLRFAPGHIPVASFVTL